MPPAPYFRHAPDGPIELVVPRADGSADVHPISDRLAHLYMVDLSIALLRRQAKPTDTNGRDPA